MSNLLIVVSTSQCLSNEWRKHVLQTVVVQPLPHDTVRQLHGYEWLHEVISVVLPMTLPFRISTEWVLDHLPA